MIKIRVLPELEKNSFTEEYISLSKSIYKKQIPEGFVMSPKNNIYPRFSAVAGVNPKFVKKFADFGYLDVLYLSLDLHELEEFDDTLKNEVKQFARGRQIFVKFFSISPEPEGRIWHEAFHLIHIERVNKEITLERGVKNYEMPDFNKYWVCKRRADGIKAISDNATKFLKWNYETLKAAGNWTLLTSNKNRPSEQIQSITLANWIKEKFILRQFLCTDYTREMAWE